VDIRLVEQRRDGVLLLRRDDERVLAPNTRNGVRASAR
jgi:hypothetical protein